MKPNQTHQQHQRQSQCVMVSGSNCTLTIWTTQSHTFSPGPHRAKLLIQIVKLSYRDARDTLEYLWLLFQLIVGDHNEPRFFCSSSPIQQIYSLLCNNSILAQSLHQEEILVDHPRNLRVSAGAERLQTHRVCNSPRRIQRSCFSIPDRTVTR